MLHRLLLPVVLVLHLTATGCAPYVTPTATARALAPSAIPGTLTATSAAVPLEPRPSATLPAITRKTPATPTSAAPTHTAFVSPAIPTAPTCLTSGGQIITDTLKTDLLRLPLMYRVYLPPCYNEEIGKRYPTLYLFHGQSSNDDQWDRLGADETADRLIAAGEIPPLIMVMPFDRYGGQPDDTKFNRAIVELLIPTIDGSFRTHADRSHRAIGGLSRGAGWAVHFGFSRWQLFGAVGAHSPAVFHTDAPRLRTWLDAIPPGRAPRVYVDLGDRDRPEIIRSTQWFEALLNEYDLPHEWHLFSGYHNEAYWSEHLEGYLRWYTREWADEAGMTSDVIIFPVD